MIYLMALLELYNTYEHGHAYHHVAGCFLDNIHTVGDMSVSELAELCNVSVATITRFFRKMSFPTASGMSYAMHAIRDARLFEGAFVPNEAQSPGGFEKYAVSLKEGIDKLTASIDPGVFEGAVSALCDAQQVHFLAVPMVLDAFLLQAELVMEGVARALISTLNIRSKPSNKSTSIAWRSSFTSAASRTLISTMRKGWRMSAAAKP